MWIGIELWNPKITLNIKTLQLSFSQQLNGSSWPQFKANFRVWSMRNSKGPFQHNTPTYITWLTKQILYVCRKDINLVFKSFTEKKLTALMFSICVIYVIGNIPQILVMILQNEYMNGLYAFQVFRNIANTLEVLNHCLNFFVFCFASTEYMRSFLINCRCLSVLLLKIPACAAFIHSKRLNSSNLSGFEQRNLPGGYTIESSRRKSSLFYDIPERKNTICMQVSIKVVNSTNRHLRLHPRPVIWSQ